MNFCVPANHTKNPWTKTVVLIHVIAFEQDNRFQEVVGFCWMKKLLETTQEVQMFKLGITHYLIPDLSTTLYKHFSFLSYLMITVAQTVYPNYYLTIAYVVLLWYHLENPLSSIIIP